MKTDHKLIFPIFAVATMLTWSIVGCELIATVDRDLIDNGTGGTGATGGGGTGGTGTGTGNMGGGGGETCDETQCPGNDTDCRFRICDASDMCDFENATLGTTCTDTADPDAAVCDGAGTCVECNDNNDCTDPEICDTANNVCVPMECMDGMMNGMETGTDCGGPDCGDCPNGQGCVDFNDCQSGVCDGTMTCVACDEATNACQAGNYCDSNDECQAQKIQADACAQADVCTNCSIDSQCPNNCVEGVCCDGACSAGCQSCLAANTGGTNGVCSNVSDGTDPLNACTAMCNAGTETLANCVSGACPTNNCTPYTCGATACNTTCAGDGQCVNTHFCMGTTCTLKKVNGQTCNGANECQSNICVDGVCCDAACAGDCQACDLGGSEGTCTSHAIGTDPENDCGTFNCSGGPSGCLTTCTTANQATNCGTLTCSDADNTCCDTACDQLCESCDQAGNVGTCTPIPVGTDPDNECAGAMNCDGAGMCQ